MKPFPTIDEAEIVFKKGMEEAYIYEPDVSEERISVTEIHSYLVAKAAYLIAKSIPNMDENKAYVLGLLHDYGKFCGDAWGKKHFHGLAGYYRMLEMGYPEIARLSLTHTFHDKNFDVNDYAGYQKEDLKKAKELIKYMEFDDYDRLIQLSDLLVNNVDGFNTIDERMRRIQKWYNLPQDNIDKIIFQANKIKKYFENKYNCNIYKLLGINE